MKYLSFADLQCLEEDLKNCLDIIDKLDSKIDEVANTMRDEVVALREHYVKLYKLLHNAAYNSDGCVGRNKHSRSRFM